MHIYEQPEVLLQNLIRFNTTNPPGNEAECVAYVKGLLDEAGIESTLLARDPHRTNLIARIKGRGDAPPTLLYGHVDVVPTAGQDWAHDPFGGEIIDGYVWGRGALDMKGGDAMMISAFLRAHAEGIDLPGDVILTILSDEEDNADYGAAWLVDNHPQLFEGVKYAIGEFGGFPQYIGSKRFYPIMVAEKRCITIEAVFRGAGGHASARHTGGAMGKLAHAVSRMETQRLPVSILPIVSHMITTFAENAGNDDEAALLMRLLDPAQTDTTLDQLPAELRRRLDTLLHNSISPTMVNGGSRVNVIPSEIRLTLDGRALPGVTTGDFLGEIRDLIGIEHELCVIVDDVFVEMQPDLKHFSMLGDILKERDPEGIPVPYMSAGATDGRFFSKLGIQTYGYLPMNLPRDFDFSSTVHAANERITVEAVRFGTEAIFDALQRF